MANKTVKDAITVHGTNPQYLIEKIIRARIYESRYWKEECFGLTAELVVDKGSELRYIGGSYGGNIKTTPFLCLTLKLLQIQPEKDIVIEFIRQENFKYIRALGAFYLRLVGNPLDIYKYLEPLYNDYRKLRRMTKMGTFDVIYMDEFIDLLLREDRVFDIILPRLTKRFVHEENGELTKRVSLIEEDLDLDANHDDDGNSDDGKNQSDGKVSTDSDDEDRRRHQRKENREQEKSKEPKTEADEIAEMNALRAKLGLKPLRP
ncbi:pre-mrna-splicing factor 38a-like protein [Dermatophagoides farinae]|uniref:Pre-mRNA-splicing factor 38 n=1 Tax=Dermatophagoides farinae TaxID=6954 RepID=A0A9D4NW37_DERFA|nr:pre-mrna-splicing factor 38a-like protein [Dermatophagoides farinae]